MTIKLALQIPFTLDNISIPARDAQGLVPAEELPAADSGWGGRDNVLQGSGTPGPTVLLWTAFHLSITDFGPNGLF